MDPTIQGRQNGQLVPCDDVYFPVVCFTILGLYTFIHALGLEMGMLATASISVVFPKGPQIFELLV